MQQVGLTPVLLRNSNLGKTSKEQRAESWPVWQTALGHPDLAELARLYRGHGVRGMRRDELDEALAEALAFEGPSLLEIIADPKLV